MKSRILPALALLFASVLQAYSQGKVTLSGTITNRLNTETLIGVSIYIPEAKVGLTTNSYGFYSTTLPKGTYTLVITYVGYDRLEETVTLNENTKRNFGMTESSRTLDEVTVRTNTPQASIRKPEMSTNKLSIATIKKMPAVLGEVDVLKSILQLPGVTNAQEGATGFNVRGGSVDGNLVLLDEATVYNTSHLFGFFSVFNADVIKDLKLYKGGIPANFGGRVSSVLDIYQKEGNNEEFHVNGGIGLVSSRLLVEGPLAKGKSSFVVAGRSSYAHLFLKLANESSSAYFYDLNTKFNYKFSDRNNVFVSGYFGNDNLNFNNSFINTYGNKLVNLRWNHIFSSKIFSNASAIYSDYDYRIKIKVIGLDWKANVKNYNLKYDFKHYVSNNLTLNYGLNAIYYDFNPGTIKPYGATSAINPDQIAKKYAYESAAYISADQRLSDKLSLNYGLRYSNFQRVGAQEVYTYANDRPLLYNRELNIYEEAEPTGTINYKKNQKIASFDNLEPRLAIAYALNNDNSVKASYNRMSQYVHLISNTASATPLDIWAPSDKYLKPEISDQVALGYFHNFKDDKYSLEAETFYKKTKNKSDYIDGADLLGIDAVERVLLNGEARAYGLEMMLKKNTGKLTGWVSYTLSRAQQRTPGRTADEPGINNGEWYRANYDKMHNLSVTGAYTVSPKWSFGAILTYQSGKAATFPNGKYLYQGVTVASYGVRNGDSLSPYHRLDVSATYTPKPDKKKGWQGEWNFSIYNLYNRNNAASYSFRQNEETGRNETKRISIFGIVPSVTYNVKF
ncbi:TonB-dependent receptor [Mucilaginibacter roseus]|uniref:isocitrate dehydrogenase (NADP(+)) n=1 Tax=Mucilaginibacter roseus TaxID=1528868 RepID=A0ABS8U576_9SPHI|nr:TonB-dependent receptor [Mucilaginibacter roseus]MCD8740979.1 TonB-dependent receptor [Mucilaginibacter roseus]